MPTLLADPPAAPTERQPPAGPAGGPDVPQAPAPQAAPQRGCSKCGSPLAGDQDWCLQCGAGAPDSLRSRAPSWRSAAAVIGVLAILVAGAATAAYAALSKGGGKARQATATVAQAPTPTAATPVVPATPEGTATAKVGTPRTVKPVLPLGAVKPPKIPPSTVTPKSSIPISPSTSGGASTPTTTTPKANNGGAPTTGETQPEAILLDTNAAATYNPYNYAASNFGDPSLAIDGDTSTGWTAVVEPAVAPKMAEGLIIDLNTPRKVSALALSTSTPGITLQVSAANGQTPPASITDPAWVALSSSRVVKKKHVRLKLGGTTAASKAAHRFVVLWLSAAPASAVGTPQALGHVSIDELELFPVKK